MAYDGGSSVRRRRRSGGAANPLAIFGSRLMLWNDWSDISTLYQDSAFTTPVVALNDPIGGVLDKSRGLALGSELVTNGDFSSGTGWTPGTGWTISGGVASFSNPTGSSLAQTGLPAMPAGRWYQVEFDLVQTSGSGCTMGLNVGGGIDSFGSFSGTGHKKAVVLTTVSRSGISITGIGNSVISIDNVTLKELSGNHAFQATSASRPLRSARVNLLTYSEQFDNASGWTNVLAGTGVAPTISANVGVAPDGSTTADRFQFSLGGGTTLSDYVRRSQPYVTPAVSHTFSIYLRSYDGTSSYNMHLVGPDGATFKIVVTGAWQRFEVVAAGPGTIVNYAFGLRGGQTPANSNTADVLVWGADLRATNAGVGLPAYQRIGAATDYDTTGFPFYASLDGTDDSWATAAIDFSASDKIAVFAAVRKLSDAATGVVAELGPGTGNGAFYLASPRAGANPNMGFNSKGTTAVDATSPNSYAAPLTSVLSGIGDISAPAATLFVNGTQVTNTTTTQGTGNYANAVLNIGRRNNASLPFNGQIYQLFIVQGAVTAAEIAAANAYCNSKSMAY